MQRSLIYSLIEAAAYRRRDWNAVTMAAVVAACLLAVPVVVVLSNVFTPSRETWAHLAGLLLRVDLKVYGAVAHPRTVFHLLRVLSTHG